MRSSNTKRGFVHWCAARASGLKRTAALRKPAAGVRSATRPLVNVSHSPKLPARRHTKEAEAAVVKFSVDAMAAAKFRKIAGSNPSLRAPAVRATQPPLADRQSSATDRHLQSSSLSESQDSQSTRHSVASRSNHEAGML